MISLFMCAILSAIIYYSTVLAKSQQRNTKNAQKKRSTEVLLLDWKTLQDDLAVNFAGDVGSVSLIG
ncbi:MAG: hypothetical protein IKT90_05975, partial [Clostridia bacterium]|nr:hypothetical protein [Clostridia bacterium]